MDCRVKPGNDSGWTWRRLSRQKQKGSAPSNPDIRKSVPRDFLRRINIAQIDDHRIRHRGFQHREIERAELLPFCHDNEHVRPLGAGIGVIGIIDIRENVARLRLCTHRLRLEKLQDRFYLVCLATLLSVMVVGWIILVGFLIYTLYPRW